MKNKTLNLCMVPEGKLFFHFNTGGGGSSGNKREIETETNFLLHCTEYKEIQERPLSVRNTRINILVKEKGVAKKTHTKQFSTQDSKVSPNKL